MKVFEIPPGKTIISYGIGRPPIVLESVKKMAARLIIWHHHDGKVSTYFETVAA